MLSNLSERAKYCYVKAEECREQAKTQPFDAAFWLEQETMWVKLSDRYELQRRTAAYLDTVRGPQLGNRHKQ